MPDAIGRRIALLVSFSFAVLALPAQESVEGRLLRILRDRGVIDAAEYEELCALEAQLRLEDDLEQEVELRIDEMVARLDDAPPDTSYKVGRGFWWATADGRFSLSINGRFQVRVNGRFWDENPRTNDEDEHNFDVRRAHLNMRGNAFEKYVRWHAQFDLAGDEAETDVTFPNGMTRRFSSRNELTELRDGYLEFTRWKELNLRGGQFRVPYSRHQLTPEFYGQFVDYAATDSLFAPARDVGLMVYGSAGGEDSDLFEYSFGVFDGEGENFTNDDEGLLYAARFGISPFGAVSYVESDLGKSESFRLALAVNGWLHEDDDHVGGRDDWSIGADLVVKWRGLFALVEVHYRENGVAGERDVEVFGWMVQIGYTIVANELDIAFRTAHADFDHNGNGDAARREYLGVIAYYWHDHFMKAQLDFGRIEDHEGDHTDNFGGWVLRVQFQVLL